MTRDGTARVTRRGEELRLAAVLDGLDFDIEPGARLGVIGPNGGGKSTMLRILVGLETADAGELTQRRGLVVGFVSQQPEGDDRDALEIARAARPDLRPPRARARRRRERARALVRRPGDALAAARPPGGPRRALDGGRAAPALTDAHARFCSTSGSKTTTSRSRRGSSRAASASSSGSPSCLLRDPDVLLLDEPEAHLDVQARERLESVIAGFDGAVVAVSHDRYLLDEIVSTTAELTGGRVRVWPGNYSAYTVARELELQRQQQLYVTQQKEIARLEEAIRRFEDWAQPRRRRASHQAGPQQAAPDRPHGEGRAPRARAAQDRARAAPEDRGGERVVELHGVGVALGGEPDPRAAST